MKPYRHNTYVMCILLLLKLTITQIRFAKLFQTTFLKFQYIVLVECPSYVT